MGAAPRKHTKPAKPVTITVPAGSVIMVYGGGGSAPARDQLMYAVWTGDRLVFEPADPEMKIQASQGPGGVGPAPSTHRPVKCER